jgi:integrase/recombinase XerD
LSPATIAHTKSCIGFFAEFLGGINDVSTITADDLRRLTVSLKSRTAWENSPKSNGKRLSPVTVNTYIRAIKSFWSWLKEEDIIVTNPLAMVPAPRVPKKIPRIFSESELKIVLNAVHHSPREKAIVELLIDSGIRLSELSKLMVDDVDTTIGRVKVFGKGSKERYTYICPATALTIYNYLQKVRPEPRTEDRLFLTVDGYPLTTVRLQKLLEVIGRKAGLKTRLSAHKLRHTYTTLCLRNGNNLEYVRITLGHSDIKTTSDAYLAVADSDIANACKRFSLIANLVNDNGALSPMVSRRRRMV